MNYLIALLISIALTVVVAVVSFLNLGSNMSERDIQGEAQRILKASAEIQSAAIAHEAIYGKQEFVDETDFLQELVDKNLLKDRVANDPNFGVKPDRNSLGMLFTETEQEKVCQEVNAQYHSIPVETAIPNCDDNPDNLICCLEV